MARSLHITSMRILVGLVALVAWSVAERASAVTLSGGESKKSDCYVEILTNGLGFPAGAAVFKGSTCADGDVCDADGVRNGVCLFTPMVCLNVSDPVLPKCSPPAQVSSITFKGKFGKGSFDTSALDAAVASLGLPSSASTCSGPVNVGVPVTGPDKNGELLRGTAKITGKSKTTKGVDKDKWSFVCIPGVGGIATTTTTTTPGGPTTTTTVTLPGGQPGPGLVSEVDGTTIDGSGHVVVAFHLTDAGGVPLTPTTSSTDDPKMARVRFTIARLDVDDQPVEGVTTPFTHYENYIINSSSQPSYDTTGTFTLVNGATGAWSYTFGNTLPADLPRNLTHTVGGQVQRTDATGTEYVANPIFNFVPNGSAVTTVREVTTTAQCNGCHDPLAFHGGGRREVHLCQLCHTDQLVDADSGNEVDLKHVIHRLHRGKDLPSVTGGPVGAKYGFGDEAFGEKVNTCASGPFEGVPCGSDADCGGGGATCTATATIGIGFPQDIRNCTKCHASGATAADHLKRPSALACTGCHDTVNPSENMLNGLAPGAGHVAGPQPDQFCRLCHTDTQVTEFDNTVPGAHVIPLRSTTLQGLQGEILTASGAAGGPVTITFRMRNGDDSVITSFAAFNTVRFALSGPTTDFGGTTPPLINATVAGGGANGSLMGPDGAGIFTYVTAASLPAEAVDTWRVGLEARRTVSVNGQNQNEAVPNPVLDFSVDGSPVVARRTVVDTANCGGCHGTFSKDFSIHGNLRNRTEYCVVCHNPSVTDFDRRKNATATGADPTNESIAFRHLIHKIHRGENLDQQPYLVYGFGGAPKNYSAHVFSEVRFPGDLRDCEKCHAEGTQTLPLASGLLPTVQSIVSAGTEQVTGETPPTRDVCTSCHDTEAAAAHAETNTTASGAEACAVCHGEGSAEAVTVVHALDP